MSSLKSLSITCVSGLIIDTRMNVDVGTVVSGGRTGRGIHTSGAISPRAG